MTARSAASSSASAAWRSREGWPASTKIKGVLFLWRRRADGSRLAQGNRAGRCVPRWHAPPPCPKPYPPVPCAFFRGVRATVPPCTGGYVPPPLPCSYRDPHLTPWIQHYSKFLLHIRDAL